MPPGKEPITGIEKIKANYEGIFQSSRLHFQITIDEIKVAGDWAVCHGRTLETVHSKTGSSVVSVNDKYMMMLEKKNSDWKSSRLIWNRTESL